MDYMSALSAITPTPLIPDMGKTAETPNISPIPGVANAAADPSVTFKDTIQKLLGEVNTKLNVSDENTRDLATGATGDIQKVVTSVEEANLALQYTMAIRSKLLDAYSEISRLQV
jgi:flagellar hook-basal body complex protein FliE